MDGTIDEKSENNSLINYNLNNFDLICGIR